MRRRLDLNRLSDQILIALYLKFFDDSVEYLGFQEIRELLKDQPANAVRMELTNLVQSHRIVQKTVQRTRISGLLAAAISNPTTHDEPIDGFKISKNGIQYVEEFGDEYYSDLEAELGSHAADSKSIAVNEEDDWEPIPLDRDDELQQQAVKALDRIVDELRSDNGYAVTHAEEKTFIQDKLATVTRRLKEDSHISATYLREFALKPLGMIIRRFGGAAIGVAATAAKEALTSWLKSKGILLLDNLFK